MIEVNRLIVKKLIELSGTIEEADQVIREHVGLKTVKEKIAFLKGMFDCKIIDQKSIDSDEMVYALLLTSIISEKYGS